MCIAKIVRLFMVYCVVHATGCMAHATDNEDIMVIKWQNKNHDIVLYENGKLLGSGEKGLEKLNTILDKDTTDFLIIIHDKFDQSNTILQTDSYKRYSSLLKNFNHITISEKTIENGGKIIPLIFDYSTQRETFLIFDIKGKNIGDIKNLKSIIKAIKAENDNIAIVPYFLTKSFSPKIPRKFDKELKNYGGERKFIMVNPPFVIKNIKNQ